MIDAPSRDDDSPKTRPWRDPFLWQMVADRGEVPLILIRHGQTQANVDKRFIGQTDEPLNPEGRIQIQALARRLAPLTFQKIYTSPLSRAQETALALSGPLAPVLRPDAMELHQGVFEGRTLEELLPAYGPLFHRWAADPSAVVIPEGETLAQCQARMVDCIADLAQAHRPGPPVVLVTHHLAMSALALWALGLPLTVIRKVKHANTALDLYTLTSQGGLRLQRLNDHAHLMGPPSPRGPSGSIPG